MRARQAAVLSVLAALVAGVLVGATPASGDASGSPAVVQAYVTEVYRDLFGRNPDPTGLATWTNALQTGTPYGAVANSITASREFRGGLITQSYRDYLGRGSDPSGLENWLAAMNQGMQIEQMQAGFISSPEFFAASGSTDVGWITQLYQKVLGRSPAPSEVNSWMTALARGGSRSQVASGFLYSTEHLTTVVNGYYLHLLDRGIDPSGAQSWVTAIQGGARDEQIIAGIVASEEYRSKFGAASAPAPAPAPVPPAPAPPVVTPPPPVVTPPSTDGRPGASNTGVPAGTVLTVRVGDLTVTTPNAVLDSMDIRGFVQISAPGVVIKNSIIRGRTTEYDKGLVMVTRDVGSVTIQDSELAPTTESPHVRGIIGANFTLTRVNIHHVIDQVLITGDNVTVQNSWFHDNSYFAQDPNYNNTPSHNDNIQISIGKNLRFLNNTMNGTKNAVMMITQDRGTVTDLVFSGNDVDGGACSINLAEKAYGPLRGLTIKDNVFGRNTKVSNCAILSPDTTTPLLSVSNNVYTDGVAVTVHRG